MNQPVHLSTCPVCGSGATRELFLVKDHTVSGESFPVAECSTCTLRFTRGAPGAGSIGSYYQSENYISHTNTSKGLVNRLYQLVRKRTLKQKRKLVRRITGLYRGSLLDIGSGTGAFASEMKENGWEVTGLEPDAGARERGKTLFGIKLEDSSLFYQLPAASFDAITMWHVLEHVHDLHGYMGKLGTLLKEKGKAIIAVPNYTSYDAQLYKAYWAAYDVPRHLYHFSPAAMQVLMEKHGLKIVDYLPMWFDSYYVSLLSSKYRDGKTKLLSAFWNGFRSNGKARGDVKKCSSVIYIVSK